MKKGIASMEKDWVEFMTFWRMSQHWVLGSMTRK